MKVILSKNEEAKTSFNEYSEMRAFAKEREEAEIVSVFYANEAQIEPSLASAPMLVGQLRETLGVDVEDVSDETMLSVMEGNPLIYMKAPIQERLRTFPIAELGGFPTLVARAGFNASDPAFTFKERGGRKRLTGQAEANVLNMGLEASNRRCLALIRDERVYAVHSGEKGDYIYTPLSRILEKADEILSKIGEFKGGEVTHELSSFTYLITDEEVIGKVNEIASRHGAKTDFDVYVRIVTSDVAACGINVYPIIRNKKGALREICFGRPIKKGHVGYGHIADDRDRLDALLADVAGNIEKVFASISDIDEALSVAETIKLNYPVECFCNMAKNAGLSQKAAQPYAEMLAAEYREPTAADAFWLLYDAAEVYLRDTKKSGLQVMSLYETINRMALGNIKTFDMPEKMAKVW